MGFTVPVFHSFAMFKEH